MLVIPVLVECASLRQVLRRVLSINEEKKGGNIRVEKGEKERINPLNPLG